jgi:hypothetical protein
VDLSKFKERLGADFAALEAYVAELTGKVDAARTESIDGRKALKARVAELTTAQAKVMEKLGIDSLDDIDTLPDAKGQAEAAKQFDAKVKRLERELADAKKAGEEMGSKHKSAMMDAALEKALAGQEWANRDIAAMLVKSGATWEEDQILFQAGDKRVPLADGVKYLVQIAPNLVKSAGAGGSGYQPGGGKSAGQANPWAKGSHNITEQIRITQENPQLAASMKSAAAQ